MRASSRARRKCPRNDRQLFVCVSLVIAVQRSEQKPTIVRAHCGGPVMRPKLRFRLDLLGLEERLAPAVVNFALTQAQSSAVLSGNISGSPVTQQGAGSLTTTYTGAMQVDLDLTNNTITFLN